MFYLDWKINLVDIIIDLSLVILTTGITYYLFSIIPSKKRLKTLKDRLKKFNSEIKENILDSEKKFKKSYRLYEEEIKSKKNENESLVWSLIEIKNWKHFFSTFRYLTLLNVYFNDYWQGRELMLLINSLVTDNRKHIELSIELSKLDVQIKHTQAIIGKKHKKLWKIESEKELIKNKKENELMSLVVKSIEDIYETSNKINKIIYKIV